MEQSFMANKFQSIQGWSLSSNKAGRETSLCDGYSLVGGFDVFGREAKATKL